MSRSSSWTSTSYRPARRRPATPAPHPLYHRRPPSLRRRPRGDGAPRPPPSPPPPSHPPPREPPPQPQQRTLPRVPRQQPIDQPPAAPHHLARQLDPRGAERRELHPQPTPP